MANDWYVSSAVYAGLATWAASTAYTVGNLIKPTAPATGREYVFRCTTAGTSGSSEPSWATAASNASTVSDGGAVWTNVSGQSTYGWSAAAGSLFCISNAAGTDRTSVGDRVFLSSDHSESGKGSAYGFNNGAGAFGLIEIISVNRGGSVPPVAADITVGAAIIISSGSPVLEAYCNMFWQGMTITYSGTGAVFWFNSGGAKSHYLKDSAIVISDTSTTFRISSNAPVKITLDNTTVQFGATAQGFGGYNQAFDLTWLNTPSAIQGSTLPTTLFVASSGVPTVLVTCRGVDFSIITGTLFGSGSTEVGGYKALLESCRIASGVTRLAAINAAQPVIDEVELINCYDGTNVINERHTPAGDLTADRSTYLTSGAQDDIGNYSLKLVSSSRSDFTTMPFNAFAFDVENTVIGSSKTATVEVISSASLNNVDIRLLLEYMGGAYTTTWNPADLVNVTLSNGNLTETPTVQGGVRSTTSVSSGKYYFEYKWAGGNFSATSVGICDSSTNLSNVISTGNNVAWCNGSGAIGIIGLSGLANIGAFAVGDVCCVALDAGNKLIWFRHGAAGNWNGSGTANPATGTGGYSISTVPSPYFALAASTNISTAVITANFGATTFVGSVPSGFMAGLGMSISTSIASFVDSLPNVLTASSALPSSSNTWNNPPSTPVKQLLQVTFTPQVAGRVRGLVRLGKPSATVWVNPSIAIT